MSPPPAVDYFTGMFSNEPMRDFGLFTLASELEATCFHEASHAVADYLFGRSLLFVGVRASYQLDDNGRMTVAYGGEVRTRGTDKVRIDFNYRRSHFIHGCISAAGPAGERRFRHEVEIPMRLLGATEGDHHVIDRIGKAIGQRGRSSNAFRRHVWHHAQKLVANKSVWNAISEVASALNDEAACELDMEEAGEAWAYIQPTDVYAICRRNGLKRGMLLA